METGENWMGFNVPCIIGHEVDDEAEAAQNRLSQGLRMFAINDSMALLVVW